MSSTDDYRNVKYRGRVTSTHSFIHLFDQKMPRCQGRPEDGLCPDRRNDESVHNTIADLFLCHACEDYRWPVLGAKPKKARAQQAASKPSNAKSVKAKKNDNYVAARPTQTGQQSANIDTNRLSSEYESVTGCCDDDESCQICNELITGEQLKCDICNNFIHGHCSGLPSKTVNKLLEIIHATGWVCSQCRAEYRHDSNRAIQCLQNKLAAVTEQLSDVLVKLETVETKLLSRDDKYEPRVAAVPDPVQASTALPTAEMIQNQIHQTLADVSRRKNNIVITGLPEVNGDDERAFLDLCEKHFTIKPVLAAHGCRRLGNQPADNRPRKLLVHLNSEHSVTTILKEAKQLRRSDDDLVAGTVYINPDLSKAELRMAFERRQRRRLSKQPKDEGTASNSYRKQENHNSAGNDQATTVDIAITSQTVSDTVTVQNPFHST